jgi:putative ABC transport system permease protein
MIKHYLKVAFRNLARQKVLTGINILGLSIGLACFILFLLYAVNEFTFDRFHKDANNIFRVYRWTEAMGEEKERADVYMPMPLGPAMKQEVPDVKEYVRFKATKDPITTNTIKSFERQHTSGKVWFAVFTKDAY